MGRTVPSFRIAAEWERGKWQYGAYLSQIEYQFHNSTKLTNSVSTTARIIETMIPLRRSDNMLGVVMRIRKDFFISHS